MVSLIKPFEVLSAASRNPGPNFATRGVPGGHPYSPTLSQLIAGPATIDAAVDALSKAFQDLRVTRQRYVSAPAVQDLRVEKNVNCPRVGPNTTSRLKRKFAPDAGVEGGRPRKLPNLVRDFPPLVGSAHTVSELPPKVKSGGLQRTMEGRGRGGAVRRVEERRMSRDQRRCRLPFHSSSLAVACVCCIFSFVYQSLQKQNTSIRTCEFPSRWIGYSREILKCSSALGKSTDEPESKRCGTQAHTGGETQITVCHLIVLCGDSVYTATSFKRHDKHSSNKDI